MLLFICCSICAFDEQGLVVIAAGAAEDHEVVVAMDVVGDAKARLEVIPFTASGYARWKYNRPH